MFRQVNEWLDILSGGYRARLRPSGLTSDRAIIIPNADGTIPLIGRNAVCPVDDFLDNPGANGSGFRTVASGGAITLVPPVVASEFGVLQLSTSTSATGRSFVGTVNNQSTVIFGSAGWKFISKFRLPALSDGTNSFRFFTGFHDSTGSGVDTPTDGCFLYYTHSANNGNWSLIARSNNVETGRLDTNSVVAIDTDYYLEIDIPASASGATFTLSGALLGTISGLPTGVARATGILTGIESTLSSNAKVVRLDRMGVQRFG